MLEPVVAAHQKAEEALQRKAAIEQLAGKVPSHYTQRHHAMLVKHVSELKASVERHDAKVTSLEDQIVSESAHRDKIKSALDRDEFTLRIKQLEVGIKEIEITISSRRELRRNCDDVAEKLQLGLIRDEATFEGVRVSAVARREKETQDKDAAEQRANEAGVEVRELNRKAEQTDKELKNLLHRRVLIPDDFQNIRDLVCQQTGLSSDQLPFAGELIEVKPERDEWTGAIERLLHTFGVSMLVPERHYQKVAPLVNRQRLLDVSGRRGLRFFFNRVPDRLSDTPANPNAGTVPACLNYRSEHPLSRWVAVEIQRSFHHVCCLDTQELERHAFGVTREGLLRSGTRHVKDDRRGIDDRTNYVLGWSPQRKIEALEQSLEALRSGISRQRAEEEAAKRVRKNHEHTLLLLDGLMGVASFADIDLGSSTSELQRLQEEKRNLEEQSETRQELQRQLKRAEGNLKGFQDRRDQTRDDLNTARNSLGTSERKLEELEQRLSGLESENREMTANELTELAGIETEHETTLENIEETERKVLGTLQGRSSQQQRLINQAREAMGSPMRQFLDKYPEEDKDLQAGADYATDFVKIHARLVTEDLPAHEERFRDFLNDNLTQHVGGLDAALRGEVKTHQLRLTQVNTALSKLEYSSHTFVEIHFRDTRDAAIREFKGQLRDILGTGMNLDDHGRLVLFEKIRLLVARFRTEQEWTRQISDSRNWLDFGIRELRSEDKVQVDYFDSSQGKSGGQKAKLAFTILAAALHAQYGLAEDAKRTDTFRLVIIDEIFARTDEPNSRRALTLFQNMGFQLILAAPWEAKVRIAEPFVSSYHLALNPNNDASTVLRATRTAYETAREQALARNTTGS